MAFQPVQSGCWQAQVAYRWPARQTLSMTPALSATTVSGDLHGATCSSPASSVVKVMSCGQKSVERAGRPGRLTGMAAGGSVAKLETVSVSGTHLQ